MRVYDRCSQICLADPVDRTYEAAKKRTESQTLEKSDMMQSKLKEIELQCGKNCLRKYDKVYKFYSAMEQGILQNYYDDYGIDPEMLE